MRIAMVVRIDNILSLASHVLGIENPDQYALLLNVCKCFSRENLLFFVVRTNKKTYILTAEFWYSALI